MPCVMSASDGYKSWARAQQEWPHAETGNIISTGIRCVTADDRPGVCLAVLSSDARAGRDGRHMSGGLAALLGHLHSSATTPRPNRRRIESNVETSLSKPLCRHRIDPTSQSRDRRRKA
jgi:hypothetical protein